MAWQLNIPHTLRTLIELPNVCEQVERGRRSSREEKKEQGEDGTEESWRGEAQLTGRQQQWQPFQCVFAVSLAISLRFYVSLAVASSSS